MQILKTFRDSLTLIYDQGKFDQYCIFLISPTGYKHAPLDVEYFTDLKKLADCFGANYVYQDFCNIYQATTPIAEAEIFQHITYISQMRYAGESLPADKVFSILYAAMVAEENKAHAILKKRIKRLGIHQLLFVEGFTPEKAAQFSKGLKWEEIAAICNRYGF
jgi:hypothetical protein